MAPSARPRQARKPPPPLDPAALDAIALRYVERFQTTRARLVRLLHQKLRQRGWQEGAPPPDLQAVAERMAALGYVDDAAYAEARARGLARRGMGAGRVKAALHGAGVSVEDRDAALEGHDDWAAAVDFARRKRLGPFGAAARADPAVRRKQLAAMARAGHGFDLARRVIDADSVEALDDAD
jgi:regulatory protein